MQPHANQPEILGMILKMRPRVAARINGTYVYCSGDNQFLIDRDETKYGILGVCRKLTRSREDADKKAELLHAETS